MAERGHRRGVDAAVVHHAERLEVVLERVADDDRARVDVRVEREAHGGEVQDGERIVFGCDAGEARVEVAVACMCLVKWTKRVERRRREGGG